MQDKPVNPMAPGYPDNKQESQILPWAAESIPSFEKQSLEVWPSFTCSQPGQPFGFKLPSQASTGGMQSTGSYNSLSSSGHPLIFSPPISRGSSSASSRPMSKCGSNSTYQQDDWDGSQSAPPKQLSQLHMLAMAKNHTLNAPQCNSHVSTHSSQSLSGTPVQGQHPVRDDDPPSPPPQPLGLHQTQSFSQLPSTIAKSHTMFAQNTEGEVGPDEDGLVIDEVSPSEDDCFVEAVVHSKSESCYFYTHESR